MAAKSASDQASAASATANYQAAVAANNAKQATINANYATQAGNIEAGNQQLKTAALVGAQRAAMGANGLDINSGSSMDVQSGTQLAGDVDAMTIRSNAAQKAYSYQVQGAGFTADQGLDQSRAANAIVAGQNGVASSILGGASSVADKWSKWQNAAGPTTGLDMGWG